MAVKLSRPALVLVAVLALVPGLAPATHEKEEGRILLSFAGGGAECGWRPGVYCASFIARGCEENQTIDGNAPSYALRNIYKYTSARARVAELSLRRTSLGSAFAFELSGALFHKSFPCEPGLLQPEVQYFEQDLYVGDVQVINVPKGTEYLLFQFGTTSAAALGTELDWRITFRHVP